MRLEHMQSKVETRNEKDKKRNCQVRSFIVSVSQEYSDDNLPIVIFDIDDLQERNLSASEKIFVSNLN